MEDVLMGWQHQVAFLQHLEACWYVLYCFVFETCVLTLLNVTTYSARRHHIYIYLYIYLVHLYRTSMEMHHLLMLDIILHIFLYQTCHSWGIGCLIKGGTMHFEYISEVLIVDFHWLNGNKMKILASPDDSIPYCWWVPEIRHPPVEVGSWNPIIYRVLAPSLVVVWDFWTINSMIP